MTLGEKLREARKQAGLSQEQLAEKINVSRSAVAKWESDKGIPDVENLKGISSLLCVSIDYLLDNSVEYNKSVIREAIDLNNYGKGIKKKKKDKVVREKYPNAEIFSLLGKLKLTKEEKIIDHALAWICDMFYGIPEFINAVKNYDKEFYLVNKGEKQFLVTVTDEYIESCELIEKLPDKKYSKYELNGWKYINCGPIVYA